MGREFCCRWTRTGQEFDIRASSMKKIVYTCHTHAYHFFNMCCENNIKYGGFMKSLKIILIVSAVLAFVPLPVRADSLETYKEMVEKSDAVQAMSLANQWKWTKKDIKTYVNTEEIVFEFPDKTVKKVALPEDEMVVAIAPYVYSTHG